MVILAHAGTHYCDESIVKAVPTPDFTKTWHPHSHADVITALEKAFEQKGLPMPAQDQRQYSLSKNGGKMFGVWEIIQEDNVSKDMSWSLGLRNSIDKAFAVGICAGNHVFVCDNLVFDGQFIEFRKHTSGLDFDTLIVVALKAIDGVIVRMKYLTEWHLKLKEIRISDTHFKTLAYDAMKNDVFPPSKFNTFLDCYDMECEVNSDHAGTLYAFHGAVTRSMKGNSLFSISDRSTNLHKTCNNFIDVLEDNQKPKFFQRVLNKIRLF